MSRKKTREMKNHRTNEDERQPLRARGRAHSEHGKVETRIEEQGGPPDK